MLIIFKSKKTTNLDCVWRPALRSSRVVRLPWHSRDLVVPFFTFDSEPDFLVVVVVVITVVAFPHPELFGDITEKKKKG
jgi:hypothetical protein